MQRHDSRIRRQRRHNRIRARVKGTAERPRLCVYRSLKHLTAQVIDDVAGKTLAAASDKDVSKKQSTATVVIAAEIGTLIAKRAKDAGITSVVFDRGGHAYHGQVKALADAARTAGLQF
ncbi:MAG: 50S ribosomal protein L18 [Candidatus Kerfeldbacteria bacterium]